MHVPHLLDPEVVHVVRRLVARGDLSKERGQRADLSAYDAAYMALAEGLNCPLIPRYARTAASPGYATVKVY